MQTTYKRDQDLWSRDERNAMQSALNAMQDPEAPAHPWSVTAATYGDRGKPRAGKPGRAARPFRQIRDALDGIVVWKLEQLQRKLRKGDR